MNMNKSSIVDTVLSAKNDIDVVFCLQNCYNVVKY